VDLRRHDAETRGFDVRLEDRRFEERLTLRNSGAYFYHPDIVTFSLGGSFGLGQEWHRSDDTETTREGTLSGYNAVVTLLRRQPFSLTAFASRGEASTGGALAGRAEILTETRGVTLSAARLYIPSTLTLVQERRDEETEVLDSVTRSEQRRNIVRYDGRRGWLDSDVDLHYELVDEEDPLSPRLDTRSHAASLNYGMDFGLDLNRHWQSSFNYGTRIGLLESTSWSLNESLRIDHSPSLRTDYRYFLLRQETPTADSTSHQGSVSLQHQLYENLTTTPGADVFFTSQTFGETENYRGRLDTRYTKRLLPFGGRLNVGLGGSLLYQQDRFQAAQSAVTQETHVASTPIAQPIALDNAFVVQGSVAVSKIAQGPVPVGCLAAPTLPAPLAAGADYDLRTVGDATEIVPQPCTATTLGINPGDTIAVDYRFALAPSRTFTRTAWHGDVSVDYTWLRVFFRHTQFEETLLAGRADHFLNDEQTDAVGADLRYDVGRLRAGLSGEARRTDSTRQRYDSVGANASLDLALRTGLAMQANSAYVITTYPRDDRETRSTSARLGLTYGTGYRSAAFGLDASAALYRSEDTRQGADQVVEHHLGLRGAFRKLEVTPTFDVIQRDRDKLQSREYRFFMRTIRRF